jgi:hypothetical protein
MSLPWFRFYREVKDDPKMGAISDSSFRVFCESLCWACEKENHGGTGLTRSSANWAFRRDVTAALNELFSVGLLCESSSGEIIVPKWEDRQSTLDSSRGRVAKYRERLKMSGAGGDYEQHRDAVYLRDGGRCVYCGSSENLCLDHMKPLIRGGTNEILNLATACKACNSGKSGRTPEEAGYSFFNKETEKMYVTVTKSKCNGYSNMVSRSCHGHVTVQSRVEESRVEDSRVEENKLKPAELLPVVVKINHFKKPTLDEIKFQCAKIGLSDNDGEKFFNYQESKGWKVGNSPMKSWPHALTTWKLNKQSYGPKANSPQSTQPKTRWDVTPDGQPIQVIL